MHTLTWSSQQVVGAGLTFDLASCIYSIFDSCFRCFGVHTPLTAVKLSGLSWDKKWSSIWPFSKPTICLYSSFLVLDFYIWYSFPLHCSSSMHSSFSVHLWLCHSFLTHPFFFFFFYTFIPFPQLSSFRTFPPAPSSPPVYAIFFPVFTLFLTLSYPRRRYEMYPVCADLQGQILACYKENVGKTLNCSSIAALYLQCVNNNKQVCI